MHALNWIKKKLINKASSWLIKKKIGLQVHENFGKIRLQNHICVLESMFRPYTKKISIKHEGAKTLSRTWSLLVFFNF